MRAPLSAVLLAFFGATACSAEGGRPGGVFEFASGGRGAAMGGAFVALADDASAVQFNPAGLSRLQGQHLSLMRATLYEGAAIDHLAYARQGRFGGWGGQVLRLSVGDLSGRDEFNNPTGGFDYQEQAFTLGYGSPRFFDGRLALGVAGKMLRRSLGPASNSLVGVDLGLQHEGRMGERRVTFGLAARNLGSLKMGDTEDALPMDVRVGVGAEVLRGVTVGLNLSADLAFEVGTEYALGPGALRLGLQDGRPTFGAGVKFRRRWSADFALSNHPVLGLTNLVSLGFRFGEEGAQRRVRTSYGALSGAAEKALDERRYVRALELFEKAQRSTLDERDPSRSRDAVRFGRLRALAAEMRLESNPEAQKALAQGSDAGQAALESVKALMENEGRKSLLLAQAAYGSAPGEGAFRAFLDAVAKLNFEKPRLDELFPRKTLVEVKLRKAQESFGGARYDEAAEHCRDALLLDARSALAHERLGSAYFALGLKVKAVLEWRQALELDPSNQSLKEFLRRIGETP